MTFTDGRGKKQTRTVNLTLDIRSMEGLAGYPWVLIAANPHLSIADIERFLCCKLDDGLDGVLRSRSWIQRRLFLFRRPKSDRAHPDGKDERAIAIMQDYPTMSARNLSKLLKQHGINREKTWVWRHRCD